MWATTISSNQVQKNTTIRKTVCYTNDNSLLLRKTREKIAGKEKADLFAEHEELDGS